MNWTCSTFDLAPPAAMSHAASPTPAFETITLTSTSLAASLIQSAFDAAQREVDRYEQYVPRWDGYQAEPFSQVVLRRASTILNVSKGMLLDTTTVPALVTTGPASDGSIDVELKVGPRRVIMTLYADDDHMRLRSYDAARVEEHVEPLRADALEKWLGWLGRQAPVQRELAADSPHP